MNRIQHMRTRQDARRYPRREQVGWALRPGEQLRQATVADESTSGIGLIVQGPDVPYMGGTLRVSSRRDAQARRARVVRVSDDGRGRTRVGCRWIRSAEHE